MSVVMSVKPLHRCPRLHQLPSLAALNEEDMRLQIMEEEENINLTQKYMKYGSV